MKSTFNSKREMYCIYNSSIKLCTHELECPEHAKGKATAIKWVILLRQWDPYATLFMVLVSPSETTSVVLETSKPTTILAPHVSQTHEVDEKIV